MKIFHISIVLLLCTLFLSKTAVAQEPSKGKPNVIIIYTDDQGYADMNIYGSKDLYTPYMDELAKSGIRFTQFYSAAPICSPSRASLLTGRYPQRAQLADMASSNEGDAGMPGSQYTMAEMFKDAGYFTAHIGKWHLGYTKETEPNDQGFDYSFGFMGGCIDNYSHFFYWNGPNRHDLWRNGKEIYKPGQFFPNLMVTEAKALFHEMKRDKKPFFLYWAINVPHYPLQPEKKWLDYYKNLPMPRKIYAAFVSTMDERIGALMGALEAAGLKDNTIIVFQSDQGFSHEGRTFGGGGSAGPFRGSKFSLFEGGVRVPAMISWPGKIQPNQVRNQLAANIDWFPTLAAMCNITLPNRKIDGKSLVNIINDKNAYTNHEQFYWQSRGSKNSPQWSVRFGDWKLLHNPYEAKKEELNANEFFLANIKDDAGEQHNVADEHPDIVKRLTDLYENWIHQVYEQ
ncbi:sulfatase [Zhouia sp. PK063]|uniref:sulfatase n=1 Tax=Zhouia sp. PK063 TaxID=3373602 RepID=UPI0037A08BEE